MTSIGVIFPAITQNLHSQEEGGKTNVNYQLTKQLEI